MQWGGIMKNKIKTQKDVIELLKKELPKYGFSISEKSLWDNYNAKTGKWKGVNEKKQKAKRTRLN